MTHITDRDSLEKGHDVHGAGLTNVCAHHPCVLPDLHRKIDQRHNHADGAEELAEVAEILEGHGARRYAPLTNPPGSAPVCSPLSNVTSPDFTVQR